MAVWIIRGGKKGEREELCLREGLIIIGWERLRFDLSTVPSRADLRRAMEDVYPDWQPSRFANYSGQVYRFVNDVRPDDYVVMPRKGKATAAVGRITGPYEYRPDLGTTNVHCRPVKWLDEEVPRAALPAAVTDTMRGAAGTVTRVRDPAADSSMQGLLDEGAVDEPSPAPIHLLLRWQLDENPSTVLLHKEVADSRGSVWWGKLGNPEGRRALSVRNLKRLRQQLERNVETHVYLYRVGDAWRTRLLGITTDKADVEEALIPDYYGEGPHHLWVRLSEFEHLEDPEWVTQHLALDSNPSASMKSALMGRTSLFFVREVGLDVESPPPLADIAQLQLASVKAMASGEPFNLDLADSVYAQVTAALRAGKHVILTGPPGTAKTTLAQVLAAAATDAGLSNGYLLTTATADWTTYETIGGLRPTLSNQLAFEPGHFLAAIKQRQWLIIDELNRSNFDRAFGQLFTVLSGQPVTLPYEDPGSGKRVSLVPPSATPPANTAPVVLPPSWRLIATMNVFDKSLLFEMSYALMRRFAFVEVGSPPTATYMTLVSTAGDGDEAATAVVEQLLPLREVKDLGPAMFMDIARYVVQRRTVEPGVSEGQLIFESFYSYLLPQFEGIDEQGGRELYRALKNIVSDSSRLRTVLVDVLGLEEARLTGGPPEASEETILADEADAVEE